MNIYLKSFVYAGTILMQACLFSEDPCSIDHATVSFYAVQVDTGEVIASKNSDLSLIPSSCMKIVTTGAALHLLGADHRFETDLEYDGVIDDAKTLHGNLYVRGGGDPCLGLSWKKQIETWVDAIQKLGIHRIEGKIIGDATRWEKALAVPSWVFEDLGNYYGAGACALSFHENSYSLFFKPGSKVGEDASILRTDPPLPREMFQNEVKTGPEGSGDRACIYGSEFSSIQFIRGTIPFAVNEFAIRGAIPDPATYCADLLARMLQERGIAVGNQELGEQSDKVLFHTTDSPTVGEIVHWTNRRSMNLYAEHLLKRMGEVVYNEGSTTSGIKAVTNFWSSEKIDLSGFNMADGSGLSRKNLITAKQLVDVLLAMKKSSYFPIFFDSLPQKDGLIRAKSGSMSLAKAYAGYTGNIAFAIMVNNCSDRQIMNEKINAFLLNLASLQ